MRRVLLLIFVFCMVKTARAQVFKEIHANAVVADLHNDIISICIEKGYKFDSDLSGKTDTDLNRMKEGGLDVQVFSVFCDETQENPYQFAHQEIDTLYEWVKRNPDDMMLVTNEKELNEALRNDKLASMIGVEGGHMIEQDLDKLEQLFQRGARYLTLTWNNNTEWATSAEYESGNQEVEGVVDTTSQKKGLNEFGEKVVKRMNELGMMIDLSHPGEQTFWDVINTTTKPVLVSHSNAFALSPAFRNLKDEQIIAVGRNGGVIGLNFYAEFVDPEYASKISEFWGKHEAEKDQKIKEGFSAQEAENYIEEKYAQNLAKMRAPFNLFMDHLEHIIKLAGIDHVAIGGDLDGFEVGTHRLEDVSKYPHLTEELVRRGYSNEDINKILGGNFLRVFKANLGGN